MWRPESVQAQLAGNGRFPQVTKLPEARGVILGILVGAMPPCSPNPGPISDL